MNDKEFIELLNLYVDREISPEDALRLEKVVATNPRRREIYDQYCRIQKACSMLSEETLDMSTVGTGSNVVDFPTQSPWRIGAIGACAAAAVACAVVVLGIRNRPAPAGTLAAVSVRPVAAPSSPAADGDSLSLKPVALVRLSSDKVPRPLLADAGPASPTAQLDWIGDIHLSPVSPAGSDFTLNPKTDIKAAVISDTQGPRDPQEPAEMTAFRFQR
jgi:hypothetical protein